MNSNKEYLGDGVYVTHDEYGITLTTENGISATNAITLEPSVYVALVRYVARVEAQAALREGMQSVMQSKLSEDTQPTGCRSNAESIAPSEARTETGIIDAGHVSPATSDPARQAGVTRDGTPAAAEMAALVLTTATQLKAPSAAPAHFPVGTPQTDEQASESNARFFADAVDRKP